MKKYNGKILKVIDIKNVSYVIKLSQHSIQRIKERNINNNIIINNILSLDIINIKDCNNHIIIIDRKNNISIVASINKYTITIITVINKSEIFIKEGTEIINL